MHHGPQSTFSLRFQIRLWIFFIFCFTEEDVENFDVTNLSQDMLRSIEADSFWCMSKLLDGIQVSRPGRSRAPVRLLLPYSPSVSRRATPASAPLPLLLASLDTGLVSPRVRRAPCYPSPYSHCAQHRAGLQRPFTTCYSIRKMLSLAVALLSFVSSVFNRASVWVCAHGCRC